jgi:uncharacterized protein YbjT (DUF2867 family)
MAKKSTKLILVTGATGKQGGAVVRHLQKRNFAVKALTRDPEKPAARALFNSGVTLAQGDLDDSGSLLRALEDVSGVFSAQDSTGGKETEVRQGKQLVDAANRSGVSQFLYSSVASADQKTGIPHFESKFEIEEHLRASGLHYTILRPVFFMENWLGMREQIGKGTLAFPLSPDTQLQMVAVDDIGAFAALAFEHPGHWENRAFELAGDSMSVSSIAEAFERTEGHPVKYQQVPWDAFEKRVGREPTTMFRWFENVGYSVDIGEVRHEYPNLTNFERWLNTNWQPAQKQTAAV